jgi:hypothetical protein
MARGWQLVIMGSTNSTALERTPQLTMSGANLERVLVGVDDLISRSRDERHDTEKMWKIAFEI